MTAPSFVHIQLGLFGVGAEVVGIHVVAAHTRTLPDGSEVFVSEHIRWNRGRQAQQVTLGRRRLPPPIDHPSLFDPLPMGPPPPELPMEEIEVFPGAFQLPLWRAS